MLTVIIRSVFKDGKYYPQVFLDDCLHELKMLDYDRIDISEGIEINKMHQKSVIFVITGILKILVLNMNHICNGCNDLITKAMNFSDVAIVSFKESDYRIHFWYMSKDDAIIILNNSNLDNKKDCHKIFLL